MEEGSKLYSLFLVLTQEDGFAGYLTEGVWCGEQHGKSEDVRLLPQLRQPAITDNKTKG